jgi:hypothetical protein
MRRICFMAILLPLFLTMPRPAISQALPFTLVLTQDQQTATIGDGAVVTMAAGGIGQIATASLSATYRGAAPVNISRIELTGSADFSLTQAAAFPVVVRPGEAIALTIGYRPSGGPRATARLQVLFDEAGKVGSFTVSLAGTVPDLVISYLQLPAGNSTLLGPGDVLRFPDTAVRSTSTIAVTILNRGSGSATLSSAVTQGAAFQVTGLPLLPATLEAGRELRVNVVFSPAALGDSTGTLTLAVSGRSLAFPLAGKATGPDYTYELVSSEGARAFAPDSEIVLPDVPVGQRAKLSVRVRNRGNAEGRISAISVVGAGFAASDMPFLPVSLAPGSAVTFSIDFDATQPGRFTGRLRIGDDSFQLAVLSLGGALQISYESASGQAVVPNNGSILFPPVPVGSSASVRVSVRNTGTTAAQINLVVIAGAQFSLAEMPELPLVLNPNDSIAIRIVGAPTTVALVNGSLRIEQMAFNLSLAGQPAPPLPAYRFSGTTGSAEPMQQVAVGLTLDNPYSLPIKGVLTLTFVSDTFTADPAVQLASGGKTVAFEIPANATTAIFPGSSPQVRFQTGSVAGAINLTPAFFYEGTSLTPAPPPPLVLQIPQSAPRILSAQVASRTAGSFSLAISGFATSRSVQQIEFEFIFIAGLSLPPMRFTLNGESVFANWYQSAQSQQFGSLFTVTVPFNGSVSDGKSLADVLETARIRVSNQMGASSLYELALR